MGRICPVAEAVVVLLVIGLEKEMTGDVVAEASFGEGEVTTCSRLVSVKEDEDSVFVLLYFEIGGNGLPLAARRARCWRMARGRWESSSTSTSSVLDPAAVVVVGWRRVLPGEGGTDPARLD